MKFGKSLFQVIELSDPEWGPYWINYKFLKKKIHEIVLEQEENLLKQQQQQQEQNNNQNRNSSSSNTPPIPSPTTTLTHDGKQLKQQLAQSNAEVEFFKLLKKELKKTSDFFHTSEILCKIRKERLWGGLEMLKNQNSSFDDTNAWTRLMASCVRFYKDVLLLENYAIMNYCGFSKILKKHDKRTGYSTRDAFMIKVMSKQNFTQYPYIVKQLKEVEAMFEEIQKLHSLKPILEEEKMFIAAIRDLNYQASQLQNEENSSVQSQFVETDSNPQCESSAQGGDSISGESKTRTDALFEASVRAVVADPAPNMQSILTWMHSVSTTGALVPIPATTAYLPRGLGQEKPKVSVETNPPNWEGNTISIYTPTQSSLPSAKPNTQNQSQVPSKSNPFNGTNFNLPNSSTNSTVSSFSHRKHPLPNDDDEREIKRRMFERILPTRTPSATDSLCTEDQSLPDDDEN